MKYRCNTPTCDAYFRYGASGIKVCDEWNNSFLAFEEWALANGYKDGLTIDRIDSKGNYCPENCQWLTKGDNTAKSNKICQHRRADKGLYYGEDPKGDIYLFWNANEFSKEHKLNASCIRACANGSTKTTQGWKFWHENT